MEKYFPIVLIILILAVWIVQSIRAAMSEIAFTWKAGLNLLASACLITGALGFFGAALSASGGLDWLPNTFEWPIGSADNVLIAADGSYIVPHAASGRIQIYDRDLKFQRGWAIKSNAGLFKLSSSMNNEFDVYVARGNHKYRYDVYGKLLSADTYDDSEYSKIANEGTRLKIPTPAYLYTFTHPFASWFVAVIGMFLLFIGRKLKNVKTDTTDSSGARSDFS